MAILLYLTSVIPYPLARSDSSPTFFTHVFTSTILFLSIASSRLSRGLFSLSTQQLAQSRLAAHQRASFAGAESALVSVFGLLHGVGTAAWSQPRTFGWLAVGSWVMVGGAAGIYGTWWIGERKGGRAVWGEERVRLEDHDVGSGEEEDAEDWEG